MTDKTKEAIKKILDEVENPLGLYLADEALAKICAIVDEEREELPTADLIAELEKRRPCERCAYVNSCTGDSNCMWNDIFSFRTDNFKPSK